MIKMIFLLLLILMVIMNGMLIIYWFKYRLQKYILDRKFYGDRFNAVFSALSLVAIIESIFACVYDNIPNFIEFYILLHIAIMFAVLIYYTLKYIQELKHIKDFYKNNSTQNKVGRVKGREVEVKNKNNQI